MKAKARKPDVAAPERYEKRVHVAMPVRVTCWDDDKQPHIELACTLDISAHGARLFGLKTAQRVGQIVALERSRNRVLCRVVWIGEPDSDRRGQVGLRAVEIDRTLWDAELREMAERFDPVPKDSNPGGGGYKRRAARLNAVAVAHISRLGAEEENSEASLEGKVANISEIGCFVSGATSLPTGTRVQVTVNLPNFELSMRGKVRHTSTSGLGIEFRQIRKGDRQLLKYWLQQLSMPFSELALELG